MLLLINMKKLTINVLLSVVSFFCYGMELTLVDPLPIAAEGSTRFTRDEIPAYSKGTVIRCSLPTGCVLPTSRPKFTPDEQWTIINTLDSTFKNAGINAALIKHYNKGLCFALAKLIFTARTFEVFRTAEFQELAQDFLRALPAAMRKDCGSEIDKTDKTFNTLHEYITDKDLLTTLLLKKLYNDLSHVHILWSSYEHHMAMVIHALRPLAGIYEPEIREVYLDEGAEIWHNCQKLVSRSYDLQPYQIRKIYQCILKARQLPWFTAMLKKYKKMLEFSMATDQLDYRLPSSLDLDDETLKTRSASTTVGKEFSCNSASDETIFLDTVQVLQPSNLHNKQFFITPDLDLTTAEPKKCPWCSTRPDDYVRCTLDGQGALTITVENEPLLENACCCLQAHQVNKKLMKRWCNYATYVLFDVGLLEDFCNEPQKMALSTITADTLRPFIKSLAIPFEHLEFLFNTFLQHGLTLDNIQEDVKAVMPSQAFDHRSNLAAAIKAKRFQQAELRRRLRMQDIKAEQGDTKLKVD